MRPGHAFGRLTSVLPQDRRGVRLMLRSAVLLGLTACSFGDCGVTPAEPISCILHVTDIYPPDNPQVPGARPIQLHVGGISDPESVIYESPGLNCSENSRTEGVHWS